MAIDHDERRAYIAKVTIDLVAREGLAAASLRRIAAEAGFSTTAITGYFADKQELLVWTFSQLAELGEGLFTQERNLHPGDPIAPLLTMVPWCKDNLRRWNAYLAFWDEAARDPELAALVRGSTVTGVDSLRELLRTYAPPGADIGRAGTLLNGMIQGLSMQMLVDRANWSEAQIRIMLQEAFELSLLRASAPAKA